MAPILRLRTPTQNQTLAWVTALVVLILCQSIVLLRTLDWIEDYGAHEGGQIYLDMPEMSAVGLADVIAIEPCPEIQPGPGRLVTGTFCHTAGIVLDLKVESESKPIGVTPTHPFWSVSRQDWVAAGELRIGEGLETLNGTTVVESIIRRPGCETVYNIEVEGDHVYRVGESGILVHNLSQKVSLFSEKYFGGDFYTQGIKPTTTGANGRAEVAEGRICSVGQERPALKDPVGWKTTWNSTLPGNQYRVARCHLLGNQFGGSGTEENLVPCCQTKNQDMAVVENEVADFIEENGCVDIQVIALYSTPGRKIPLSIEFKAIGQDCSTNGKEEFEISVTNPSSLFNCPTIG